VRIKVRASSASGSIPKTSKLAAGLAIAILLGGLLMLFNGISAFGDKGK
jgi:hypothetical protein